MVRPVCGGKEEIEERIAFDRDTLGQEQHDDVIDPTSTGRSVCGRIHKATRIGGSKRGARNCFQSTRTVTCSCEKTEHLRVQELLKKIGSHPNWAMWSYSSCAKLYQQYIVLTDFFTGIKELSTAFADNLWLTANPEESFTNYDWMHSLSRTT